MENRFSYNPKSKEFITGYLDHSEGISKQGKFPFDTYIRGILKDNVLYLRLYYPLKDIDQKSIEEIEEKSFSLLFDNLKQIKALIKKEYNLKIKEVVFNAKNDLLKGILTNI